MRLNPSIPLLLYTAEYDYSLAAEVIAPVRLQIHQNGKSSKFEQKSALR